MTCRNSIIEHYQCYGIFSFFLIYLEIKFSRASVQIHLSTSTEKMVAMTKKLPIGAAQTLLKNLWLLYNPIATFPCYCY